MGPIRFSEQSDIPKQSILHLYGSLNWACAEKPEELYKGLLNSHSLVSAWNGDLLVGLGLNRPGLAGDSFS